MRIVVLPPRGVTFPEGSPWNALIKGLQAAGHEVEGFGHSGVRPEAIVTLNDQPEARRIQEKYSLRPERSVLVVLEPKVTAPAMYTARTLKRYGHRFAASPIWARSIGGVPFLWPQDLTPLGVENPSHEYRATMINGDKRSAIKGSLYGLRRSVIRTFEDAELPLAVFGPGWSQSTGQRSISAAKAFARSLIARESPDLIEATSGIRFRPQNWMGTVSKKSLAFSRAPITIIIENSADYVSEKLFDALRAEVLPIYVGPPLGYFHLPEALSMHCPPHAFSILAMARRIREPERLDIMSAGRAWLSSPEAQQHEISNVLADLSILIDGSLRFSITR